MALSHMDRLSATDATFLTQESTRAHMHIGGMLVFEGPPPDYEEFLDHVGARLHLVPRFRQKLAFPRLQMGRPLWIDDPTVAAGGSMYQAAVDHAKAIAALLDGDRAAADASFARAAAAYLERGWLLLAHELAWQRLSTGSQAASEALRAAVTFYETQGATWRLRWLAERRHAEVGGA